MKYLRRSEIQIPLYFLIISLFWLILSNKILLLLHKNLSAFQIADLETIKGFVFIAAVTFFIHISMRASKEKLLQSREEYKDLFYNTPNPMILYNIETKKFIDVNKAALETYGYSPEEFLKMSIDDLHEKLHLPGEKNIYKYLKKNNEVIICQETTRKIAFKNMSACLLSTHDITELENAKAELAQRELQLRLILNSISDGFFILRYDLTIEKGNELFERLAEVAVEDVKGYKLFQLFPSIKEKFLNKVYISDLKKGKAVHFEMYYERTKIWYRISAYPYEGRGFSVFFRDISWEKENELQIHQNEQNLLALINNTEDLIWSIGSNYTYFTFNEPFKKWYKKYFNEDVWNGKIAFSQNQENEFDTKWKNLYIKALNGEKFSVDMDFEIDNKIHFTTVRFNPIYNVNKKVFGVVCFLQNITESTLYEKKIEQQNLQLREIAFITSHKVRVPLANILGLAEVLDEGNPMSASNQEIIHYIKASAKELDKTIKNMIQQTAQSND